MATLCFLPSDTSAAVTVTPSGTDWSLHVNAVNRQLLFASNASALTTLTYTPDAADHLVAGRCMVAQFVSGILPPQTINGQTIVIAMRANETVATNNLTLAWKLYAVNADGSSVLGTLIAIRTSGGGEMATAITGEGDSASSSTVTLNEPFRLVFEVGGTGTPTASASVDGHNMSIAFGTASAVYVQDADTTAGLATIQFDENLITSYPARAVAPTLVLGMG